MLCGQDDAKQGSNEKYLFLQHFLADGCPLLIFGGRLCFAGVRGKRQDAQRVTVLTQLCLGWGIYTGGHDVLLDQRVVVVQHDNACNRYGELWSQSQNQKT